MSSDVVLTAALRSNLLSLQSTQSLIDKTQLRLATGLKVNSALDNAQNFFAAQSLNNRASDLTRLLDGIGQSITAIKQADSSVQSLTKLVDQADSIGQQARDALAAGTQEAKVTGVRDLSAVTNITTVNGVTNGDQLVITVSDPESATPGANVDFDTGNVGQQNLTITLNTNDSIDQIIANINDNGNLASRVVEARLDDKGQLEIKATNGGKLNINFLANAAASAAADTENLALAQALGFGDTAILVNDGTTNDNNIEVTALATPALTSFSLYNDITNAIATRSSLLEDLETSDGTALAVGLNAAGDDIIIGVNNGTLIEIETNGRTIQNVIDDINTNASLNELIAASYDETTGQITIRALDATVTSVQFGFEGATAADSLNLGFGTSAPTSATGGVRNIESFILGQAAGRLAELEDEFNNVRTQIDQLVADSGYRGTNLLNGDDLTTFFNEDRSNTLVTEGVVFTSAGLGISEANFGSATFVDSALSEIRAAVTSVRSFGSSIANDLSIIQTREDFTKNTINNLEEGRDKLTIADQNEEGANLLSLQTRQTLGVTSLSLASQSQQSVLRLF
jgi:flagellin